MDLPIDARAFDATTFSKSRQRLSDAKIADRFFAAVVAQAKLRRFVSSEHFSVDGTLLEAWALHKSFTPKDKPPTTPLPGRNSEVSFHGKRRLNETLSRSSPATNPSSRSSARWAIRERSRGWRWPVRSSCPWTRTASS